MCVAMHGSAMPKVPSILMHFKFVCMQLVYLEFEFRILV